MAERIHLYLCPCAGLDPARAAPRLTPERRARLTGPHAEERAAAGLLLRFAALELLGQSPEHEARAPGGRPFLPEHPEFFFSLSHSGGWALCAAGFSPVGADIQAVRPVSDALLARFFSEEERALICDDRGAIRLFSARESCGKLTGRGLSRSGRISARGGQLFAADCPVFEPDAPDGFVLTVCAPGADVGKPQILRFPDDSVPESLSCEITL